MLKGKIYKTKELNGHDLDEMFGLMFEYYDNINRENFLSDFEKKDDVVILRDEEDNVIKGFSTILFYDLNVKNEIVKILFSGDTIIHKNYWAHNNLANVWLQYAIKKQKEFNTCLYWLLISKGYKTYKYLNTFFKEYYPNPNKQTPEFEQQIIDKFGTTFHKNEYDPKRGILYMNKKKDYLKREYASIPENQLKDRTVKFFIEKNPEYYEGNELICVTNLSEGNINNAGKRLLGI